MNRQEKIVATKRMTISTRQNVLNEGKSTLGNPTITGFAHSPLRVEDWGGRGQQQDQGWWPDVWGLQGSGPLSQPQPSSL